MATVVATYISYDGWQTRANMGHEYRFIEDVVGRITWANGWILLTGIGCLAVLGLESPELDRRNAVRIWVLTLAIGVLLAIRYFQVVGDFPWDTFICDSLFFLLTSIAARQYWAIATLLGPPIVVAAQPIWPFAANMPASVNQGTASIELMGRNPMVYQFRLSTIPGQKIIDTFVLETMRGEGNVGAGLPVRMDTLLRQKRGGGDFYLAVEPIAPKMGEGNECKHSWPNLADATDRLP